uniref:CSON012544 protein n=1 Tax=Culicoides sonorensis TaxID=179676 RepID=A0A336K2F8_CULSO
MMVITLKKNIKKKMKKYHYGKNYSNSYDPVFSVNYLLMVLGVVLLIGVINNNGVICQVCGPPAVPLNAKVTTQSKEGIGITEARYECDSGYELFGSSTIQCDPIRGWTKELPFCGTNVAYRKPTNQSSSTRGGPATYANDGKLGNQNPDGQECSETLKEASPWWKVDLLAPQMIKVVRITTRGCCGHQPLQDLEIRVGNSSTDLQRNPLCAWHPGTLDEGTTKEFLCARPLIGQFVAIQLVGEGSLSLCEVEIFSNDEFTPERCAAPNLNADTVLTTFAKTCYEFHVTRGESFEKARGICQSHGGDLLHDFKGAAKDYVLSELERRKTELKTQLVWIGAQKEPGLTNRLWKWVNGDTVLKPTWGKDQPNNYNGEQNCVVLDGGRGWLWNDVGCNLDYLHFVCQHAPLSCGSPDSLTNTTIIGKNYSTGNEIQYQCPKGHSLIGDAKRTCEKTGNIDCGQLPAIEHGSIILPEGRTTFGAIATYTCHENYTLIGNENRTCELAGWTGTQPQCLVDWCPEPPSVQGGKMKLSGRRAGSTVTYECEHGYILIGEPILSCGLGGEWTGKPPMCRFVDCGTPARPDRGSLQLLNDSTTVGSMVKYYCQEDYWLVGSELLFCTKESKWIITCETPHVPPGSFVVGYDYNVHSTIEYHCDPGYVLRDVDCGSLTPIPHGSVRYLSNTTHLGSEVLYSCTNSHKLNGIPKRTCLESGLWSDTTPKCEEIRCPEPTLAPHSILSVTGNDRMYGRTLIRTSDTSSKNQQTYKIGALAKYSCERGYKIIGDPLITCEENGFWNVDCGQPPDIEHGKVILATNFTYYGAAAHYECKANFKLCAEDGTWSQESPVCREITCDEPDIKENLIVDSGTRLVGASAKYKCPKGYFIVGNDTRKCLSTGQWTGKAPKCKPVDCGRPNEIENGRVIVVNDSTLYGVILNDTQTSSNLGTGIAIASSVILILLLLIAIVFFHRNKSRPVKNTENVQAAERKDERSAAVMSYSTLEANNRHPFDVNRGTTTFDTFQSPARNGHNGTNGTTNGSDNIYDQIPNEQYYDAPYEMRNNDEVYEPEPPSRTSNMITINGISVR